MKIKVDSWLLDVNQITAIEDLQKRVFSTGVIFTTKVEYYTYGIMFNCGKILVIGSEDREWESFLAEYEQLKRVWMEED